MFWRFIGVMMDPVSWNMTGQVKAPDVLHNAQQQRPLSLSQVARRIGIGANNPNQSPCYSH